MLRATILAMTNEANTADPRGAPPARVAWLAFIGVLVVSFALAVFALRARSVRDPHAAAVLLVVPFENLTGDRESDVWCDGLTEEVISELASADPRRLYVIGRTTSMAYRAAHEPLREIRGKVNADYALEGAVRKVGDLRRVTAQLYRLREETPVWAAAFETTGTDVLSIERTLLAHLVGSLGLALDLTEMRAPPPSAAQEALAKARYLSGKNDASAMGATLAAFEEALRIDPDNAAAWSELAVTYDTAGSLSAVAAMDKSCAAARRAHDLSKREVLAETMLAGCALQRDWDFAAAESAFESALAKAPGLAAAHQRYAAFLSAAGRHREASRTMERAKSLDPLSPAVASDAGWHAYLGRDYPAAIRELSRALELEPKDTLSREHLMMARALSGDATGASNEARLWASMFALTDEEKTSLVAAAPADAVRRTTEVTAQRMAALAKAGDKRPHPGFIAVKYAGAGDKEETLAWLERAASEHAPQLLALLRDPRLDWVRADTRFIALLERTHLPAEEPRP